jgi:hypothetical protein
VAAIPIKAEYGPTLGQLLAPRWRAASRLARGALIGACVLVVVAVVAIALTLINAHYSRGGEVPFSFNYRGLYRTTPEAGGFVKVQRLGPTGKLEYSYAIAPLQIPAYGGSVTGELPLYAATYSQQLSRRFADYVPRGEGKTRVNNNITGYEVLFTATAGGSPVYGRAVMLLPQKPGVRRGVEVVMLTAKDARGSRIDGPMEVAGSGLLLRPLKTFSFG